MLSTESTILNVFSIPTNDPSKIHKANNFLKYIYSKSLVMNTKKFENFEEEKEWEDILKKMFDCYPYINDPGLLKILGNTYRFDIHGELDLDDYYKQHSGTIECLAWIVSYFSDEDEFTIISHYDLNGDMERYICGKDKYGKLLIEEIKCKYFIDDPLCKENPKVLKILSSCGKEM